MRSFQIGSLSWSRRSLECQLGVCEKIRAEGEVSPQFRHKPPIPSPLSAPQHATERMGHMTLGSKSQQTKGVTKCSNPPDYSPTGEPHPTQSAGARLPQQKAEVPMPAKEYHQMLKSASLCTLSLALAMALNPGATMAQSHCKGLEQKACSPSIACQWREMVKEGEPTKAGTPRKRSQKAHCRLDIKAAAKIAAKARGE